MRPVAAATRVRRAVADVVMYSSLSKALMAPLFGSVED
jgi:hypothetical protein